MKRSIRAAIDRARCDPRVTRQQRRKDAKRRTAAEGPSITASEPIAEQVSEPPDERPLGPGYRLTLDGGECLYHEYFDALSRFVVSVELSLEKLKTALSLRGPNVEIVYWLAHKSPRPDLWGFKIKPEDLVWYLPEPFGDDISTPDGFPLQEPGVPAEPGYHLTVNGKVDVYVDYGAALARFVEILNATLESNLTVAMDLKGPGINLGFYYELK